MSKRLLITMPDGFVYQVPMELIAAEKAGSAFTHEQVDKILKDESLSDIDKINTITKVMREAVDTELNDDEALIAWSRDKLEWKDVVKVATVFTSPDTSDTYTAGWKSGEMKTIEVDDDLEKLALKGIV